MRTAIAAFTAFYNLHLGRDWKLFRLVRSPSPQTLPTVLTRAELTWMISWLVLFGTTVHLIR